MAVGFVLAVVLLELVLQVASYVAWSSQLQKERPAGRVLFCIGDSLTFGLGATPNKAYPVRLQAELRDRGLPLSVVNAGISGQSSADVLNRLPDLLTKLQPEAVCLLVGWNDTWALPAPVDPADLGSSGFPYRWRTWRLIRLLSSQSDPIAQPDAKLFLGAWHVGQRDFYFAADGTARLDEVPARWTVDGDVVQITPQRGEPVALRWRRVRRGLEFDLSGSGSFQHARRGYSLEDAKLDDVIDLIECANVESAVALMAAQPSESLAIRARIVGALLAAGKKAKARRHLPPLQEAWDRDAEAIAGEAVAQWLVAEGRPAMAAGIARTLLRDHPDRIACWRVLVDTTRQERRELAAELAAAAAAQTSRWLRAQLTLEAAVALAEPDPKAAMERVVAARADGIGPEETVVAIKRAIATGADKTQLRTAVEQVAMAETDRLGLKLDVHRATTEVTEIVAVLEGHLHAAIDLVHEAGARVFLLGYPFPMSLHEEAVQRVAAARNVLFISMVDTFNARLSSEPRERWFSDPIHCSARGYQLMAELVAELLAKELR